MACDRVPFRNFLIFFLHPGKLVLINSHVQELFLLSHRLSAETFSCSQKNSENVARIYKITHTVLELFNRYTELSEKDQKFKNYSRKKD